MFSDRFVARVRAGKCGNSNEGAQVCAEQERRAEITFRGRSGKARVGKGLNIATVNAA